MVVAEYNKSQGIIDFIMHFMLCGLYHNLKKKNNRVVICRVPVARRSNILVDGEERSEDSDSPMTKVGGSQWRGWEPCNLFLTCNSPILPILAHLSRLF